MIIDNEPPKIVKQYVSYVRWCESLNEKPLYCELSDDLPKRINLGTITSFNSLASGTATGPGF